MRRVREVILVCKIPMYLFDFTNNTDLQVSMLCMWTGSGCNVTQQQDCAGANASSVSAAENNVECTMKSPLGGRRGFHTVHSHKNVKIYKYMQNMNLITMKLTNGLALPFSLSPSFCLCSLACVNKVAPSTFLNNQSSLNTVTYENHCKHIHCMV